MTVELVLSCDHCAEDYARIVNLPVCTIRRLARDNGWERRTIGGYDLDLCGGCKRLPDHVLLHAHASGPF